MVDKLREEGMNDPELLFNMARQIVIAEIQAITYRQWLPLVVGQEIMKKVICQKKTVICTVSLYEFMYRILPLI